MLPSTEEKKRNKRPYTPAIFRKGLVMVLVPGILGSVFLLVLNGLWLSTGKLSVEAQRRNQIVFKLNDSFAGLVSYVFDLMSYRFENSSSAKSRAVTERQHLEQQLKELHDVAQYDSNPGAQASRLLRDPRQSAQMRSVENDLASLVADADKLATDAQTQGPAVESTRAEIERQYADASTSLDPTKIGHSTDRFGNYQHWGRGQAQVYTISKQANGTFVKTYQSDYSKEYKYAVETYYPNGSKRFSSKDGRIGYTSDGHGNEHHWGIDAADNYDSKKQADGTSDNAHRQGLVSHKFSANKDRFKSYEGLVRRGWGLADSIEAIAREEQQSQDSTRGEQDKLRQTLKSIVLLGLVCGAVVSFIILAGFAKDIIIRLRVLTLNAAGLLKRKKPVSRLDGDDELAYLDAVFYQTQEELAAAAEQHKSIMQMVAHDMRSPIMAMEIRIEIFQDLEGHSLSQAAVQWCDSIKIGSNRVLAFVTELLTLERLESGEDLNLHIAEFSLEEAAQECCSGLSEVAGKSSVTIKNECSHQLIAADRERLVQVLSNYLSIAVKCAAQGSVVLVASEKQSDGSITVSVTENNEGWLTSKGRGQMFGKFKLPQDADENSEFRLSLATSKVLVEAHGGTVGAISAPGIGSRFWFSIPASGDSIRNKEGSGGASKISGGDISGDSDNQRSKLLWREVLRPGLVRKAMFLTAFPLFVQAAWLFWMNVQLDRSEQLEAMERHQADVVTLTNGILIGSFRANTSLASFIVSQSPISKDLAIENFRILKKEIPALDALTIDDPAKQDVWNDLSKFVGYGSEQLEKTIGTSAQDAQKKLSDMAADVARAGDLYARIGPLLSDDLRQLSEIQLQQESFRSKVQAFIFWAIPINLAMYLGLLWVFTLRITRRLNIVVDNARKLPGREVLHNKVSGSDEIASLDALLHQAAADLADADEQRESMMDIVSHDIRSPLITVETSLCRLEQALPANLEEKAASCIKSVRGNVNRVLRLADDLLTVGNLDDNTIELELANCQLRSLAQDAVDSIVGLAQLKNISIKVDCPDLTFNIDERRMMQVLINLLSNAIKFSPKGSKVCIGGRKVKGGVQIFVEDEGKGMDAGTASKIFEKYVSGAGQTEKAFGLGLAICKLIVTAHGGTLSVDSEPGRGSTFFIFLPFPIA